MTEVEAAPVSRITMAFSLLVGLSASLPGPAAAEWYVGLYGGGAFPLKEEVRDKSGEGLIFTDVALRNAPLVGLKVGHWFAERPFIGLELDLFGAPTDITRQSVRISGTSATMAGDMTVLGGALHLLFRYRWERVHAYAGAGPAVFYARLRNAELTLPRVPPHPFGVVRESTDASLGAQFVGGLRAFIGPRVSTFVEYRRTLGSLDFDRVGLKIDYAVNAVALGLAYHF